MEIPPTNYTPCPLLQLDVEKCWPEVLKEKLAETMEEKHIINNNFNNSDRLPPLEIRGIPGCTKRTLHGLGSRHEIFSTWGQKDCI